MSVDAPSFGTALLGRDQEVANVAALIHDGDIRLVTITGPGGVGKTRLALEVARRVRADLPGGAVFVDLAGVGEADDVAAAIARTLDLRQSGTDEPSAKLRRALAHRVVLVVLDNFEQVLAAAHVPVELIERCPGVRVLVTSRAPLRVRAERVFRLSALPVPVRSTDSDPDAVAQFASVQLFTERARAIRPEFELGADNAAAIAEICRAVDGLPLAIELAAARITHLTPALLAERLSTPRSDAPLDTLGRGASDLPDRQRTMRDTIAWSYNLLAPHEQRLLRRLSIFDADCSLDAIESVCSDPAPESGGGGRLAGGVLLDALASAVDLHLIEPDDRVVDEARFAMLVTIREFGREQLATDGEYQAVRSRHAAYYATLVDETAAAWESPAEQTAAQRLERELIEIRVALRHFLETGDAASGRRMVTMAGPFWLAQGHVAEGRQWIDAFLASEAPERIPLPERARALMLRARLALDELGTEDPAARAAIRTQLEEARTLARSIDDEQLELEALVHLTSILANDDDVERSLALAEEGIALAERSNRWRLAELYLATSLLAHWTGDRERATALAVGAGALADELGNERLSIEARLTLSLTAPSTSPGVRPLADYVSRAEVLGDQRILSWLYPAVAAEALDAGRVADAARWFRASLEMDRDSGYWHRGAFGMVGAQGLASMRGHQEEVARLHGALSLHLDALRRAAPPDYVRDWEDFVAAIRDSMGHDAFDAAMRDGTARSWDEAVAEAVAICDREVDEPAATQEPRSRRHAAHDLELTARELDVLRLIAAGGTNKDVAAALGIRPKTVMHHSMAIYRKLGVRGRAEASAYAYRNGLVPE